MHTSASAGFVLCADDFAMTAGISRGIVELLERGRLSATGAMTNRPHWATWSAALRAFDGQADLGVHVNLTCGAPLTSMPRLAPAGVLPRLPDLLKAAMLGQMPEAELASEIEAQLQAFEDRMGRAPDFIDGHQHVHGLRRIQDVFVRVIARRYPKGPRPYIRRSADRLPRIIRRGDFAIKAMKVAWLSLGLGRKVEAAGFVANDGFAGFSNFAPDADYAAQFARYLVAPGPRHLVMCHPGYVDAELPLLDPVLESRERELAFLAGPGLAEACTAAGLTMRRLSQP
ncbi:MAG: ChbG/HpnK family deacetylase [Proteobacteria bacterium]|nr:ChbG/HpnK family deacetylase [Pseudomonadota bacterium]